MVNQSPEKDIQIKLEAEDEEDAEVEAKNESDHLELNSASNHQE